LDWKFQTRIPYASNYRKTFGTDKMVNPRSKTKSRARMAGSTRSTRAAETKQWKQRWETSRAAHGADRSNRLENEILDKCEGYKYLSTILACLGPEYGVLAEALAVLQVLKLDGPNWRPQLDKAVKLGGGSTEDNFAFAMMNHYVRGEGWINVQRAAECSVATMGLYLDSNSWHSAVTRCRDVWIKYKAGSFTPMGELVSVDGIVVRPRFDNLREAEIRVIIDPYDFTPLPVEGKRVTDSAFWRNMKDLGLVEILQN
jgi:hypothetical protein